MWTTPTAFLGFVAATLLACSDSRPTGVDTGSSAARGSWTLVAVDGHALPASIDAGAQIVAGELELLADGSYWSRTHANVFGAAFQDWFEGRWSVAGERIVLQRADQTVLAGMWAVNTIEIAAARTMRYVRELKPANPTTSGASQPKRTVPW